MTLWLAAAVVWCAVGARIGRVLVRQATAVRVAIAVAVVTIALNTMLLMPDVAGTFDRITGSPDPRWWVVEMLWGTFAAAAVTISEAARPLLPKTRILGSWLFYLAALVVTAAGIVFDVPIGWALVVVAAVVSVTVGVRHINWSVLGRGIAVYTAGVVGAAASAVYVLFTGNMPSPGLMVVHNLLIALGSVWILFEVWVRSLILLFRVRRLHSVLVQRFPEVVAEDSVHKTTVLRASDHVAHIMDAIYVQSAHLNGGALTEERIPPPADPKVRAQKVVRWLIDPAGYAMVDSEWISPPDGMSARRWVVTIAAEFDDLARQLAVKA